MANKLYTVLTSTDSNYNILFGNGNNASGKNNLISGNNNVIGGADNSSIIGDQNIIGTKDTINDALSSMEPGGPAGDTPAGSNSIVLGFKNKISGVSSVALNEFNTIIGDKALVNGLDNAVTTIGGHAQGLETWAGGLYKPEEIYLGRDLTSPDDAPVFFKPGDLINKHFDDINNDVATDTEKSGFKSRAQYSHTEGHGTITRSQYSHAEGEYTITHEDVSAQHVEGKYNLPIKQSDFNEDALLIVGIGDSETDRRNGLVVDKGGNLTVSGQIKTNKGIIGATDNLIPYGNNGKHTGDYSVNLGSSTNATGKDSLAIGENTIAEGIQSFAGGKNGGNGATRASGEASFAFGRAAISSGNASFATGENTEASGDKSFATGEGTKANKWASFASGRGTIASAEAQLVCGKFNQEENKALFVVGNGNDNNRSNAFAVLQDGVIKMKVINKPNEYRYLCAVEENGEVILKFLNETEYSIYQD